jgi:hypothetical protein
MAPVRRFASSLISAPKPLRTILRLAGHSPRDVLPKYLFLIPLPIMAEHLPLIGAVAPETPLWRYMKLSTFLLLLKGKAFFPSVETLKENDPLEGEFFQEPTSLAEELRILSGEDAENVEDWLLSTCPEWEQEVAEADPTSRPLVLSVAYMRELAKQRAVWCWFESVSESAGMWSVYGHQGIAVQTTAGRLTRSLPSGHRFLLGRILYINRDDERWHDDPKNKEYIHRPFFTKGIEYVHERELRIATLCNSAEGVIIENIDVGGLIVKVAISPLLPHAEAEAIRETVAKELEAKSTAPMVERSSLRGRFNFIDEISAHFPSRAVDPEEVFPRIMAYL